ncbi:hypothetical protein MYA_4613 [Burkholderia sp. KJ006]|nr:hypothetical protein MYA_4613 [Burkholderia sp. KJ006]
MHRAHASGPGVSRAAPRCTAIPFSVRPHVRRRCMRGGRGATIFPAPTPFLRRVT